MYCGFFIAHYLGGIKPMILFKAAEDLQKLSTKDPAYPIIKDLVQRLIIDFIKEGNNYIPDDHGYIALIEEADKDRVLTEIWDDWTLLDIPWEGISIVDGFFQAVFLANNEFGIVFIIPDAPWVDGKLREVIEEHLDQ